MKKTVLVNFTPNIIGSIICLIFGVILFSRPDLVTITISYIIGTILVVYGIGKIIYFSYHKGKDNTISATGCIPGVILILFGLFCLFFSGIIEQLIRFIIGALILLVGINRIITLMNMQNKKSSYFIAGLVVALALIGIGLYVIFCSNLVLSGLGIILIIYSVMEIINYIIVACSGEDLFNKVPEAEVKEKNEVEIKEIETKEKNNNSKKKKQAKK